ncbi:MAG TPA: hypothetical protein VGP07_04570 [Polyangia bacterium]
MDKYPLTTLLALRRREEEAAEASWSAALAALRTVEARLPLHDAAVEEARSLLRGARAGAVTGGVSSSGVAASRALFVERRRDELARAQASRDVFRAGPLAAARAAEALARGGRQAAQRAREAVEKHEARFLAQAGRAAEKRDEAARDDVASSNRHRRARDPDREP